MRGKRNSHTYHVWECTFCDARVEREWSQNETRAEFDAAVRSMSDAFERDHKHVGDVPSGQGLIPT